jgi:DNA-binding transcriptional regulator YhcF (GntR family)
MPSTPQPNRPESLHRQIARNIRNAIEAGTYRHNEALPSTRELAEQWDTSVFTITEAMKLLAREGLVINKSRSMRIVNAPDERHTGTMHTAQPHAILIGGYAGSGKSELGRILARTTNWPLLDKDTITRPVVETTLEALGQSPNDRESDLYIRTVRPREYEALRDATNENLQCGSSAIVTAPFIQEFSNPTWIDRTLAAHTDIHVSTTLVWVYCDAETMHTYLRHRAAARDTSKLADWSNYISGIDINFRPSATHVVIENCASSRPLQDQASELLRQILASK